MLIKEEDFLAEFDKAMAEGRVRRPTPEENERLRQAALMLEAQFKAEERKAAKKQAALVNA